VSTLQLHLKRERTTPSPQKTADFIALPSPSSPLAANDQVITIIRGVFTPAQIVELLCGISGS
jgi:hypothetical protein